MPAKASTLLERLRSMEATLSEILTQDHETIDKAEKLSERLREGEALLSEVLRLHYTMEQQGQGFLTGCPRFENRIRKFLCLLPREDKHAAHQ